MYRRLLQDQPKAGQSVAQSLLNLGKHKTKRKGMQINKYTKVTLNSCQKYRRYDRRICYVNNLFFFYFVFAKVDLR